MTTTTPCAIDGRIFPGNVESLLLHTSTSFPARVLNRRYGPAGVAGCGRPFEHGSEWTSVHELSDGSWGAHLSACGNGFVCDFCAPRAQAESRERWAWHFDDHLAGGGALVRVDLTVPHRRGQGLASMLRDLRSGFTALAGSVSWRDLGFADHVVVLQVKWSPVSGWHPHLHVTGFVPAHGFVDADVVQEVVAGAWWQTLRRKGYARAVRGRGVFARKVTSTLDALYAWSWADDAREPAEKSPWDTQADVWQPEENPWDAQGGSWSVWDLARAGVAGDRSSVALWQELLAAMKGRPVVTCSHRLNDIWDYHCDHDTEPRPEPPPVEFPVVALVGNKLAARAVDHGCWEHGLEEGAAGGALGAAKAWAKNLGCLVVVDVTESGVPLLWADHIGPPGTGRGSVTVLCEAAVLDREKVGAP